MHHYVLALPNYVPLIRHFRGTKISALFSQWFRIMTVLFDTSTQWQTGSQLYASKFSELDSRGKVRRVRVLAPQLLRNNTTKPPPVFARAQFTSGKLDRKVHVPQEDGDIILPCLGSLARSMWGQGHPRPEGRKLSKCQFRTSALQYIPLNKFFLLQKKQKCYLYTTFGSIEISEKFSWENV